MKRGITRHCRTPPGFRQGLIHGDRSPSMRKSEVPGARGRDRFSGRYRASLRGRSRHLHRASEGQAPGSGIHRGGHHKSDTNRFCPERRRRRVHGEGLKGYPRIFALCFRPLSRKPKFRPCSRIRIRERTAGQQRIEKRFVQPPCQLYDKNVPGPKRPCQLPDIYSSTISPLP